MMKKLLFTGLMFFSSLSMYGQDEQIYGGVGSFETGPLISTTLGSTPILASSGDSKRAFIVYYWDEEKKGTVTQYMLDDEIPLYKNFPLLQAVYQEDFDLLKELVEIKKLPLNTYDAFFAATVSLTVEYVFNEEGKHVDNKFIKLFADHGLKVDDYFSTRASHIRTDKDTGSEGLMFMDATGQYLAPIKKVSV